MPVTRNNLIETIEQKTLAASTAVDVGDWLMYNGSGEVVALTATNPVCGLACTKVASTDSDYASEKQIPVDCVIDTVDRFLMPCTGTATSEMEGLFYDVDSDPAVLNVAAPGTQFQVTRFINSALVEVRVAKFHADLT